MTRRTEQARADHLADPIRAIGLGRHYSIELRGVTDHNADGADRQEILRACSIGEELQLETGTNDHAAAEYLKVLRKSGEQLGCVAPHTELADKLGEGRKFRVKLVKLYPYRGQEGKQGAILDFDEVNEVPVSATKPGLDAKWIVLIGIVTLLVAIGAAKLLGLL